MAKQNVNIKTKKGDPVVGWRKKQQRRLKKEGPVVGRREKKAT